MMRLIVIIAMLAATPAVATQPSWLPAKTLSTSGSWTIEHTERNDHGTSMCTIRFTDTARPSFRLSSIPGFAAILLGKQG